MVVAGVPASWLNVRGYVRIGRQIKLFVEIFERKDLRSQKRRPKRAAMLGRPGSALNRGVKPEIVLKVMSKKLTQLG
jgi:hypothetical protein